MNKSLFFPIFFRAIILFTFSAFLQSLPVTFLLNSCTSFYFDSTIKEHNGFFQQRNGYTGLKLIGGKAWLLADEIFVN